MILGPALLVLAFFLWLLGTHYREGRFFDRPAVARHPSFDPIVAFAAFTSLAAGLALLWRASTPAGALAVAMLAGLAGWRALLRGPGLRARALRRRQADLLRAHPGMSERDALARTVLERHPEWGEELVEQMILDYRTADALARVMTRMERGFRGFRPGTGRIRRAAGRSDPARPS